MVLAMAVTAGGGFWLRGVMSHSAAIQRSVMESGSAPALAMAPAVQPPAVAPAVQSVAVATPVVERIAPPVPAVAGGSGWIGALTRLMGWEGIGRSGEMMVRQDLVQAIPANPVVPANPVLPVGSPQGSGGAKAPGSGNEVTGIAADGPVPEDLLEQVAGEVAVEDETRDKVNLTLFQVLRQRRVVVPGEGPEVAPPARPATPVVSTAALKPAERPGVPVVNTAALKPAERPGVPVVAPTQVAAAPPAVVSTPTANPTAAPVASNGQQVLGDRPWGATPATKGAYFLQVSNFSDFNSAMAVISRLQGEGTPASVQSVFRNGQRVYQLRVGPFSDQQGAQSASRHLSMAGHAPQVVRDPG